MQDYPLQTKLVHSLAKVFPEIEPKKEDGLFCASCLENEPFSFQIAYKLKENTFGATPIYAKITTDLPVSLYSVAFVPVFQTSAPNFNDHYRAGLFPDKLLLKKINPKIGAKRFPWIAIYAEDDPVHISVQEDAWRCVWLTVNEEKRKIKAGNYAIKVEFFSQRSGNKIGEEETVLKIIPASLPKQTLKYTNWVHCDCICDAHGVEIFSDKFWLIFADYIKKASQNGMNLLLTPCFTPPLDTPIGEERKTVQLIKVHKENGEYAFDFSLLEKYIEVAKKNGIEYFEHSHLFSQWGAKHAPKIMATVNGKYKQIFGWNTMAWSKSYEKFLHAYIPKLLEFLKAKGLDKKFIFHISDEPQPGQGETYQKAKGAVGNLLNGYTVGDALSNFEFYADGTVQTPIVSTNHIHHFYGKAKNLWAYYTGEQSYEGMSNRMIKCSGERNRMLGVQMYMHEIQGFLHWGYNFYYDTLSQGFCDPSTDAGFFAGGSAGSSFLVYPTLQGCAQSIRQKVFYEGINDMRALRLLEKYLGKQQVKAFVQEYFGEVTFFTHPKTAENLLKFRNALNEKIAECVQK